MYQQFFVFVLNFSPDLPRFLDKKGAWLLSMVSSLDIRYLFHSGQQNKTQQKTSLSCKRRSRYTSSHLVLGSYPPHHPSTSCTWKYVFYLWVLYFLFTLGTMDRDEWFGFPLLSLLRIMFPLILKCRRLFQFHWLWSLRSKTCGGKSKFSWNLIEHKLVLINTLNHSRGEFLDKNYQSNLTIK